MSLTSACIDGPKEIQGGDDIVFVVFRRIDDGLAHIGHGREVENSFDLMAGEHFRQEFLVCEVAFNQFRTLHKFPVYPKPGCPIRGNQLLLREGTSRRVSQYTLHPR